MSREMFFFGSFFNKKPIERLGSKVWWVLIEVTNLSFHEKNIPAKHRSIFGDFGFRSDPSFEVSIFLGCFWDFVVGYPSGNWQVSWERMEMVWGSYGTMSLTTWFAPGMKHLMSFLEETPLLAQIDSWGCSGELDWISHVDAVFSFNAVDMPCLACWHIQRCVVKKPVMSAWAAIWLFDIICDVYTYLPLFCACHICWTLEDIRRLLRCLADQQITCSRKCVCVCVCCDHWFDLVGWSYLVTCYILLRCCILKWTKLRQ